MNRRFGKYLKIVASCHVGLVVIMLTTSGWSGIFKHNPELISPVEFVVEVPGEPVPKATEPPSEPKPKEPEVKEEPAPMDSILDSVKTEPVAKKKKTIEKSTKVVTRPKVITGGGGAKKTRLTPEEIRRFLDMGAKMSDHTSIPGDEEVRCFEIVRRAMYEAWTQPGAADAGNSVAEATIGFTRDGSVSWRKLSRKSGNAIFDDSIMQAVNSVHSVDHLTPAFLEKHREITITFKLD